MSSFTQIREATDQDLDGIVRLVIHEEMFAPDQADMVTDVLGDKIFDEDVIFIVAAPSVQDEILGSSSLSLVRRRIACGKLSCSWFILITRIKALKLSYFKGLKQNLPTLIRVSSSLTPPAIPSLTKSALFTNPKVMTAKVEFETTGQTAMIYSHTESTYSSE